MDPATELLEWTERRERSMAEDLESEDERSLRLTWEAQAEALNLDPLDPPPPEEWDQGLIEWVPESQIQKKR